MDDWKILAGDNKAKYNLSLGESHLIQEAFKDTFNAPRLHFDSSDYSYPHFGGQPILVDKLQKLYPGKHIVIGNGGKQGLLASIYALQQTKKYDKLYHRKYFWPSFPTLSMLSNLKFVTESSESVISISASPNNPDGTETNEPVDIWDAAYAHHIFGATAAPPHKIAVYSASKVLGFSGFRVGWCVTDDAELARHMAFYVEITTSGVSSASQHHMAYLLDYIGLEYFIRNTSMSIAIQRGLKANSEYFNKYLGPYCDEILGAPSNGKGMFAFFRVRDLEKFNIALTQSSVQVVPGEACGAMEPGWFRMSIGHKNFVTKAALETLAKNLGNL